MSGNNIPDNNGLGGIAQAAYGEPAEGLYGAQGPSRGALGEFGDAGDVAYSGSPASEHGLPAANFALAAKGSIPYIGENELYALYNKIMREISKSQTDTKKIFDESATKSSSRAMEADFESFKRNKDAAIKQLTASRSSFGMKIVSAGVGVGMGAVQGVAAKSAASAGQQHRELSPLKAKVESAKNSQDLALRDFNRADRDLAAAQARGDHKGMQEAADRKAAATQDQAEADAALDAAEVALGGHLLNFDRQGHRIEVNEIDHLGGKEQKHNNYAMAIQSANTAATQGMNAGADLEQEELGSEAKIKTHEANVYGSISAFLNAQRTGAESASQSAQGGREATNQLATTVANEVKKINA